MSGRSAHSAASVSLVVALFAPLSVWAAGAIIVTEVMYDAPGADQGREWVEVQNTGPAPADLALWKFFEADTNHKLVPIGSSIVLPGGYAIIADAPSAFLIDWPAFSGVLFDSSFSLSNTGETLVLKDASSTPVASLTYSSSLGASGDGNSLNLVAGALVPRKPSPGSIASADLIIPPSAEKLPAGKKLVSTPPPGANVDGDSHAASSAPAAAASSTPPTPPNAILPWVGAVAVVIALGVASAFMMRQARGSGADAYSITEDTHDS